MGANAVEAKFALKFRKPLCNFPDFFQRYAKAIHRVVVQNQTLGYGYAIEKLTESPNVAISQSVARRVSNVVSDIVYFQGSKLEYEFQIRSAAW